MVYRIEPSLHEAVWGGMKLSDYGKKTDGANMAESWELSFTKGGVATIDGKPLTEVFPRETWGTNCRDFPWFPVLTKFIDAKDRLSIQVHPTDEYALAHENSYGKTEMWIIIDADEGAGLYLGFRDEYPRDVIAAAISDGTVEQYLNFIPVKAGEVYFIPSGTVHAIGKGVLLYEIQENSTLTYRLYDYMRRDKNGNLRELHVEKGLAVTDVKPYMPIKPKCKDPHTVGKCSYFTVKRYTKNDLPLSVEVNGDSYLSLTVTAGKGTVGGLPARKGDSFFVPASEVSIQLSGDMEVITVRT